MRTACYVTNYMRPGNIPRVAAAWRSQVDWLCLVDNSPDGMQDVPSEFDDVWRIRSNAGCVCRLAAASLCQAQHCVLADDDCMPTPGALDSMLTMLDRYAVVGRWGRSYEPYEARTVLGRCDGVCRVQVLRSELVPYALTVRCGWRVRGAGPIADTHDDILVCTAASHAMRLPCYAAAVKFDELPDPGALHRRRVHLEERRTAVMAARACGWRSLCS